MPIFWIGVALAGFLVWKTDAITAISDEIEVQLIPEDAFTRWDSLFRASSKTHGVPWRWIKAVCWVESDLGRAASVKRGLEFPDDVEGSKSSDGKSWGLMQVTLPTANDVRPGTTVAMLNNPVVSVDCGARVLARNMRAFPKDPTSVFRAYNGGLGFAKTVLGQRDTPAYAAKVISKIEMIQKKQPGNELEIG